VISRRRFLTGAAIALAPMGATAYAQEYKAQQPTKVPRIGYLETASAELPVAQAMLGSISTTDDYWVGRAPASHAPAAHNVPR